MSDESYTILDSLSYEDISISLPAKLNLGIDYILSDKIYLKSSIQHQMQTKFIGSVNPRFSIGAELFPKTKLLIGLAFHMAVLKIQFRRIWFWNSFRSFSL
ncbi:MAG: hypothetical protein CM15mP40_14020 [Alphaproteobacteria bacterium]|nr:MAG: hypothetical protein CM15mP40_14020 [Alphaproteobacteria bacterium]